MIQNYVPSKLRTITEYNLVFDDGYRNGFSFPCDENGKVFDDLPQPALENYNWCLNHSDKFVRFKKVMKDSWTVRDDAYGTCHCGNTVYLHDEYYGACQCDKCGQWYNLSGQELLPPEDWQEDLDYDY
jgi:hypothetical protein